MLIFILPFILSIVTSSISPPALDMTDEMSFHAVRPWVPIVDIGIPEKKCEGECKPEVPLDPEKLKRYQIYSRVMSVGYCRSALINEWSCGICNEPGSPILNTTDIRFFKTRFHTAQGIMAVNHDLRKVFLVFQGVQHNIQWFLSSKGLFPIRLKTYNPSEDAQKIKVHSIFLSFKK
jgi:hypothetical protein